MTRRFGIRTRLTMLVTVVFAAAVVLGAITVIGYVENRLVETTRGNAETLLAGYLDNAAQGGPIVVTVDPAESGVFFYLDADGNQITESQYVEALKRIGPSGGDTAGAERYFSQSGNPPPSEAADGEQTIGISITATPVGPVQDITLFPDTVAVAQRVLFVDETELYIGVANSLQPVTESITAIQAILWIVLPVLAAGVGVLTYVTVGRVLRPVHSITRQTREISATNLSGRVPVPDSRDDIAELATTMNGMLNRLDRAQQRQRQFLADASHELRSPIAASQSQLEVALAHPETADWPTTAKHVLGEQGQLGYLVDGLLALTSIDEQGAGTVTGVDLGELVREECARPRRIAISLSIDGDFHVVGNRSQLGRAIRNIIANADQHADRITATVRRLRDDVVVQIDDDGPGVPVDQRQRVFDRFTRLDEPRNRNDGGAGLGLAIVHEVVQAHGGEVECTESPLGGARMCIRLPGPP
jgi:signal transduction histidine kinase